MLKFSDIQLCPLPQVSLTAARQALHGGSITPFPMTSIRPATAHAPDSMELETHTGRLNTTAESAQGAETISVFSTETQVALQPQQPT